MIPSRHNIFSRLAKSDRWFILNPLSRQADLLDEATAREYQSAEFEDVQLWVEKGYLVDPQSESDRYKHAYLDFLEQRDRDEVQIFFAPTYACNFACSYCYQDGYQAEPLWPDPGVLEAFFAYIDDHFQERSKYLTLFGGEPLMDGERVRDFLKSFLDRAAQRKLETAIVTNGYHLVDYVPLLKNFLIREIQVTLDGLSEVHDRRRPHRAGLSSFDRIVSGIDAALGAGISINLRMVVDRENLGEIPGLAQFAIDRGWTKNPRFKTQLGRNYELHTCQSEAQRLYSRAELYRDVFDFVRRFPHILEFHKPAFSLAKFLWENGELPQPLFDACPGAKTEWAFDASGKIFACTATIGKPGEELGTFYPKVNLKDQKVAEWEDRDVTTIPECQNCSLALACGGGCASVAQNRTGRLKTPDCRPVTELLSFGLELYFPELEETRV
ncbi:MAG: radical SAM protein [Spirochaetales bacterium]|nr:radical SAM protein [Spirochaetales bacterium]